MIGIRCSRLTWKT